MAEEWYRRSSWTPADRDAFFARLHRSRTTYNKAQYLWIQAFHLHRLGRRATTRAALGLIDVLLREVPEPSQLACAYLTQGECHQSLGQIAAAVESYRLALQAQRDYPKVSTLAHQTFAWFVATAPVPDSCREALAALDEFGGSRVKGEIVPISYRTYAAKALLHAHLAEATEARIAAVRALQLADQDAAIGGTAASSGRSARRVRAKLKELATESTNA